MAARKGRRSWLLLHFLHRKRDFPLTGAHEIAWQLGKTDCKEKGGFRMVVTTITTQINAEKSTAHRCYYRASKQLQLLPLYIFHHDFLILLHSEQK